MSTSYPHGFDAFGQAISLYHHQDPYSTGPFIFPDEDEEADPASPAVSSTGEASSKIPSQDNDPTSYDDQLQTGSNRSKINSDSTSALKNDTAQDMTESPHLPTVDNKGKATNRSFVSEITLQEPNETQNSFEADTENYVRGGNRDDFVKFCLDFSPSGKPLTLSPCGGKDTSGIPTKTEWSDVFEAIIEDNGFAKRYASANKSTPVWFTTPGGKRIETKNLGLGKWTFYHTVDMISDVASAYKRGEISNLRMYSRKAESARFPEDYNSWYRTWNTDYEATTYRNGVWKLSKNLQTYRATLKGSCYVKYDLPSGFSTVLPGMRMEMTITLEPVSTDLPVEDKKTKPRPIAARKRETKPRYLPIAPRPTDGSQG